jgi:hypothetical protein
MSKLDEKLAASVKPARGKAEPAKTPPKAAAAKPAAASKPTMKSAPPAKTGSSADLNSPASPLFPARIWPD